ncbi:helix-turn-helix domain-containing protein [Limosilactobacillus caecicola]|uniref:helix-turn-helix domain-containing protein n=1 Tax=Limosilactobacillus caecicola TaxID=2941332 RepID=UPI00203CFD48|nr:helix-turn-helix transcriptional regulator [Limosilactobacillus caecicola]
MSKFKIGQRIKSRRQDLHLTQEQLAEKSNLSVNFISQLEREEKNNISLRKLSDIATALNLPINDLIEYDIDDKIAIENNISNHPNRFYTSSLVKRLLAMDINKGESLSKAILEILDNK